MIYFLFILKIIISNIKYQTEQLNLNYYNFNFFLKKKQIITQFHLPFLNTLMLRLYFQPPNYLKD